ncbi:putative deoxyribonuclease TATDN2 [Argopecten irradians]|uniref:putative deoxyribonuclease TATDN2 n=1 Tax=Argopecten irradians TaxID=31199 RepID=UPI0037112FD0
MPGNNGTEAYMLLLNLVKKGVPKDQRIHLHCFSGDEYVLDQWSSVFPNLYFGFTRLVSSFSGSQTRALRAVRQDRTLLETDSPYFPRPGQQWSAPNQLYSVAEVIAPILQTTVDKLLRTTAVNAQRLFQRQ